MVPYRSGCPYDGCSRTDDHVHYSTGGNITLAPLEVVGPCECPESGHYEDCPRNLSLDELTEPVLTKAIEQVAQFNGGELPASRVGLSHAILNALNGRFGIRPTRRHVPVAQATASPALPWHRETLGHADIDQIIESVAASLRRPLADGVPPSTDATWIVNAENQIVAFMGNGPRQTDNADLIIDAVDAVATMCVCGHEVAMHQTGEGPWTGFCAESECECEWVERA